MPNFKELYDKDGNSVFRVTDIFCRVPIGINSKILVSYLVSELVEYSNPACHIEKTEKMSYRVEEDDLL